MNTNVINTLIENPRLLLILSAESLPSAALAYWLVWLAMRPKTNSNIHTPFSWHLYGIATSLLGSTIFRIIAIATFAGRDAYMGDKALYYPLTVSAIIAGLYIHWLKKEMLKKSINTDWKETKPQTTSEKNEFIPPNRIYETEKTESIPSSQLYEIIAEEMDRKEYKKGLATRAFAEANGDKEVAKSLYIKFRYAELFSQMELERKEKQRQQQMEDERIENERTETQQEQSIWTKDVASFNWNWVMFIGICFVAFLYWRSFTSIHPSTVTSVPAQSVPQATPQDIHQRADDLYKQGRYTEALPLYQGLAEQGDAPAQFILGGMYSNGKGTAKDEAQAVVWYRKAAEQGDVVAQTMLKIQADDLYDQGRYAEAFSLYQGLAAQGDSSAQFDLGAMYEAGQGVTKDEAQSMVWYHKSAEQGDASAQFNLGIKYNFGQGVAQDYSQAVYWYNKAAEQGDKNAQSNLGFMYSNGKGTAKDEAQAVVWYRKAAEQGLAMAQFNLGNMYNYGKGVIQDYNQAVYWYRKAAEQGNANAIAALKKLGQ